MNVSLNLASQVALKVPHDDSWLTDASSHQEAIDSIVIDNEGLALHIDSRLRKLEKYELSLRLLDRILLVYPESAGAFYCYALSMAGLHRFEEAVHYSKRCVAMSPDNISFRSCLIRSNILADRIDAAIGVLRATDAKTHDEMVYIGQLSQFANYCADFSVSGMVKTFNSYQESGSYADTQGAYNIIVQAVQARRPFSMIRLGDGEGAWLHIDPHDEGSFNILYRQNRISFLRDWFGTDNLIDDIDFKKFATDLQSSFASHDLIGISPLARIAQEQGFMSMRGLTASSNIVRFLALTSRQNSKFCSSSINLSLAYDSRFYFDLFRHIKKVGLISSYAKLGDKFRDIGISVISEHVVPGDSRNFHYFESQEPSCQYPEFVEKVDAKLSAEVLAGEVYLVAAGFVGKKYLRTIRERGGIALDIGSLADHWANGSLPY